MMETRPSLESDDEKIKIQGLLERVERLEAEKQEVREEFGHQRAKMKELYLQKEEELKCSAAEQASLQAELKKLTMELDEAKSQLVVAGFRMESDLEVEKRKCQEEIATLQQLMHETVEESSSTRNKYDVEVLRLRRVNERLEHDISELRAQQKGESESQMAPGVMLSAVTKTLARKVASQLGGDSAAAAQDNLEDSMRKVNKYAKEDAEVLRSLVIPLEEEIQALKEKLREMDQQLRKYEGGHDDSNRENNNANERNKDLSVGSNVNLSAATSLEAQHLRQPTKSTSATSLSSPADRSPSPLPGAAACDMCSNYEAQLVRSQRRGTELERQVAAGERTQDRLKEDLAREGDFRKEMEGKWNEKKEEHKVQVTELKRRLDTAEDALHELRQTYTQTYTEVTAQLSSLTQHREQVHAEITRLQQENDSLVGKHSAHSRELQNELINLPDSVDELHEMLLRLNEELISAKVAKEAAEEQTETLRCEILLLRDQMGVEQEGRESMEDSLTVELNNLKKQISVHERERLHSKLLQEKQELLEKEIQVVTAELKKESKAKKQLEDSLQELRSRVGSLQTELDNSEAVQKDFVRLSQSLQVQLERIREAHTEVRWQHDDDFEECNNCRTAFSVTRRKQHCRHCGRVFCTACLSHTVPSGPNQRPSRVCDVCHTLLVPASAPYFSTEAPHTPD